MQKDTQQKPTVEIVKADTVLHQMVKGEIDQQIATAKEYPRSITTFHGNAMSIATLSLPVAEQCMYAVPRDGKTIKGPSARMAEILAHAWGNARAGSRIIEEGDKYIVAQGFFHDLETNTAITREVRRRITNKKGERYGDDMIITTANAAGSIAMRNAILAGIPRALWQDILDEVQTVIRGDEKTFGQRRDDALHFLTKTMNVKEEAVFAALGCKSIVDIKIEHLDTLRGFVTAIKSGEATVAEMFPAPSERDAKLKDVAAKVRNGKAGTDKGGADTPGQNAAPDTSAVRDDEIPE